jgi:signal transduction histidine kinase
MEFNFIQNLQYCQEIVDSVSTLLYYSHILSAIAALLIGTFVLMKSGFSLLGKILFSISLVFSFWVFSNLLIWVFYYKNSLVMAAWAPIEIWALLLFALCLYFTYVFIEKRDAPIWLKCLYVAPLIFPLFSAATSFNLTGYDIQECIAIENTVYTDYIFTIKIVFSVWILFFSIYKYIKADRSFRKQILLMTIGITIFLLSFLAAGYIAEQTGLFIYEAIGLLGMVIFVGFLGYLIVRFKLFNIKLLAAQALVASMVFLTGAGFFYVEGTADLILAASSFLLICFAGYFLTKSVKQEVEQREKVEKLAIKLEDANGKLRELDRQKDSVLHMVAHQFKGPLTTINYATELLLDGTYGPMPSEQKESVTTIRKASRKMGLQSEMVLDAAKITLNKLPLSPEAIDLNDLIKEVVEEAANHAKERKVNFKTSLSSSPLPTALLDRKYTQLAIDNLLSNAVKYTALKSEGGNVEFRVEVKDAVLFCAIEDNGIGIPKAEQENIFKELYRASNAGKEGNGLGLRVARGAIEAQGGKMTYESEEGKGTTFYIELPLKLAPPTNR